MCLYTSLCKPRIATADIVCYKTVALPKSNYTKTIRLKGNPDYFRSMFFMQDWYIGSTYKVDNFQDTPGAYNTIEHGFHSYIPLQYAINGCGYAYNKVVLKCIIPKGTRYYKNMDSTEYCSEMLKAVAWRYYDENIWRS